MDSVAKVIGRYPRCIAGSLFIVDIRAAGIDMTGTAARRIFFDDDIDIRAIAIAPTPGDITYWLRDIQFRNSPAFTAWAVTIGHQEGYNALTGCLAQAIKARPDALRKAWVNAWPEHLASPDASIHLFDKDYSEDRGIEFCFGLSAYRVRSGIFAKKYITIIRVQFPGGMMPLGYAPARDLRYSIGRANLIMSGEEIPYRSFKAALADNEM